MTGLTVLGWEAVSAAGIGAAPLAARTAAGAGPAGLAAPGTGAGGMYDEPLPAPAAHVLPGFDARALLGRKGTSTYDRATALAAVCCAAALRGAGIVLDDADRSRIGVVLGTTAGSLKSTTDFSRETLAHDRPYLVNPLLFPNAVMNYAAGQLAIRFGLRGANATIAGGTTAFPNVLRYASRLVERGHADVILAGAVEEYTPHRAWAAELAGGAPVPVGEAAVIFALAGPRPPPWAGPYRVARILSVVTGCGAGGPDEAGHALAECVRRAVRSAGVGPHELATVFTGECEEDDAQEYAPVTAALARRPARVMTKRLFGECDAASAAVALGALVSAAEGRFHLLTARAPEGTVGAAVVERCGDGADSR